MKKSLLLLFALASFTAFSQTEKGVILKGTKLLSGGFCIETSSDEESSQFYSEESRMSEVLLAVYGGYAISDNNVVGLGLSYNSYTNAYKSSQSGGSFQQDNENKTSTISIVPFYRRFYFCSPEFALVGTAKLPIGFANESEQRLQNPTDPSQGTELIEYPGHMSFGLWLAPSFLWMPSEYWSIEGSVGRVGFVTSSGSGDVQGENVDYSSFEFVAKIYLLNPFIAFTYYF